MTLGVKARLSGGMRTARPQLLFTPPQVFNVMDYGAVGNGTADDTVAVQAAFTAALTAGGGRVYAPKGTYKLTTQIDVGSDAAALGIDIVGDGTLNTLFRWYGSTSGVAFSCKRIKHALFEGFRVDNLVAAGTTIGLKLSATTGSGTMTLANTFRDVWVYSFDRGMQFGDTSLHAASEMLFLNCSFSANVYGVYINDLNSLDYTFVDCSWGENGTGVHAAGGAGVQVLGGSISGSTVTDFHCQTGGGYVIHGLRSETANRFVDVAGTGDSLVVVHIAGCDVHKSTNADAVLVKLSGNHALTMQDCALNGRIETNGGGGTYGSSIHLDGVGIGDTVPFRSVSTTLEKVAYSLRGCFQIDVDSHAVTGRFPDEAGRGSGTVSRVAAWAYDTAADALTVYRPSHSSYADFASIAEPSAVAAATARLYRRSAQNGAGLYYQDAGGLEIGPLAARRPAELVLLDTLSTYWPLSDVADSVGASTLTNTNVVTFAAGKVGNAAHFIAASSQTLSVADNAAVRVGTGDWTIAFWMRADSFGGTRRLLHKNFTSLKGYSISVNGTPNLGVSLGSSGGQTVQTNNNLTLSVATWYFITVRVESSVLYTTINNAYEETTAVVGAQTDAADALYLGSNQATGEYFSGDLDEVGIWKRALTAAERTYLYNAGAGWAYPFGAGAATIVEFAEGTAPATPAASSAYLYAKDNAGASALYYKDDAGTEVGPLGAGGAGGSVATDAIWDAKGDLAAGTGANTAAKVTVGANDTILMADSVQSTWLKWVASATPVTQAFGDAAAAGTSDDFARGSHIHGMPADPVTAHAAAGDPHAGYVLESLLDVKGDLIAATAADTVARLAAGANYSSLVADSATATGLKWLPTTVYDVRNYGAVGDGTTDDTTAINDAAAAAKTAGGTLYFPAGLSCKITATVTFECDVWGVGATITTASTILNPAVQFGIDGDYTRKKTCYFPAIITTGKTIAGWSGSDVGLKIVNAYECELHVSHVKYFSVGLLLTAFGTRGCVYNTLHIGHLENNKVNLKLKPGDVDGWTNQNTFIGGRYSHDHALEGEDVVGVRQVLIETFTASTAVPNNNVWLNASLESDAAEYLLESIGGQYNEWYSCRWELLTGNPKVYWNQLSAAVASFHNRIYQGYASGNIVFTESADSRYNWVTSRLGMVIDSASGDDGTIIVRNGSSATYPALTILPTSVSPLTGDPATAYGAAIGYSFSKFKLTGDVGPRLQITHGSGVLSWGPGDGTFDNTLTRVSATVMGFSQGVSATNVAISGGLHNNSSFSNAYLRMATTGAEFERNIADANPVLKIEQQHASSTGDILQLLNSTTNVVLKVTRLGVLTFTDASDIAFGTITGTKIGTATTQMLGFFNATPIVQPANTTDLRAALINLGLLAAGGATPLDLNGGALTSPRLTVLATAGDIGTPVAGEYWYNSTQKSQRFQIAAGTLGQVGLIYASTADDTSATGGTIEIKFASLIALVAAGLTVGKMIRVRITGSYTTDATAAQTAVINIKLGDATNATSGTTVASTRLALTSTLTAAPWSIEADIVIRSATTAWGRGYAVIGSTVALPWTATIMAVMNGGGVATVTTIPNISTAHTVHVTVTPNDTGQSLTIRTMSVELLN